jgi:alcohol dehydrogenase
LALAIDESQWIQNVKIRGAVLNRMGAEPPFAQSRPISVEDIDLSAPGPDELLVRIHAAGLCHSDLSVVTGERPRPVPMLLGHEAAGEVVECGTAVNDVRAGDRVVLVFMPSCGYCEPCSEGRAALCVPGAAANSAGVLLGGGSRLMRGEEALHHHLGCSAFATYAVVSRRSVVKFEADLSYAEAALFGCAVLTGVGAVINTAAVRAGQTVAVVGLGGVGFAALMGALCAGASLVVAIDVIAEKLTLAKELGATEVFLSNDACAEAVHAATAGGVDHAIETAGSIAALELAYRITRRGGTTTTVGLPAPTRRFVFSPAALVAEERTLKGSYIGATVPRRDIPRLMSLYQQGRLPVNRLLSGELNLDAINEGLDRLHRGEAIRQIIVPGP